MPDINLDYLNNERIIAFQRIEKLEKEIDALTSVMKDVRTVAENKITDDEKIARDAAVKAESLLSNVENTHKNILSLFGEIEKVNENYKNNKQTLSSAIKKSKEIEQNSEYASQTKETIEQNCEDIKTLQSNALIALNEIKNTKDKIEEIEQQVNAFSVSISEKNKNSSKLYDEIEDVHDTVFGYDTEKGEHENGLKEDLEAAYEEVEQSFEKTKEEFQKVKEGYEQTFLEKKRQIEELLPDALTAGLANGYVEKKNEEEKELIKHEKTFRNSIWGLVGISCIPLSINTLLYLVYNYPLTKILETFPAVLAFVLPLYFPVLWLTWNANKEAKLSKRLIEEYTHKEVVSKTYQGLAEQVKNLDNGDISYQLKERLLYNLISVNSENPGKLISDYNKPDNPLIDILDRSVALATTFDKLKNLPGLGRISSYFDKKEKQTTTRALEKAQEGIELQEELTEKN